MHVAAQVAEISEELATREIELSQTKVELERREGEVAELIHESRAGKEGEVGALERRLALQVIIDMGPLY